MLKSWSGGRQLLTLVGWRKFDGLFEGKGWNWVPHRTHAFSLLNFATTLHYKSTIKPRIIQIGGLDDLGWAVAEQTCVSNVADEIRSLRATKFWSMENWQILVDGCFCNPSCDFAQAIRHETYLQLSGQCQRHSPTTGMQELQTLPGVWQ